MVFSFFKSSKGAAADLAIDLGTANTVITAFGEGVLLNEPSLVAYMQTQGNKKKILAIGKKAFEVLDKNPGHIIGQKPIRDGVIADFELAQEMLKDFLTRPEVKKYSRRPRIVVSLPYGVTEVEKRAVIEACQIAGAKQVFLIDEPMAAAIGSGLDVRAAQGRMIIDIGGGTTEIAVIALADIVYCEALRMGGHKFDEAIVQYLKKTKKLIVSDFQAEELKINLGCALPKKDIRQQKVVGRNIDTGLSFELEVTSEDIGTAMAPCLQEIIHGIHRAIENTPPELVSDLIENGILLAGGGALIKDLDLKIKNEVRLPVTCSENPLIAIAKGGEVVLSDPELLEKIQLEV